jgi:hypothetical protein
VAQRYARAYQNGPTFRVVVGGLVSFDIDQLDAIEERTSEEIMDHLHNV